MILSFMLYWCQTTFISPNIWDITHSIPLHMLPSAWNTLFLPPLLPKECHLILEPVTDALSLRTISWHLCIQLCTFLPCSLLFWPYFSGCSYPTILGLHASLFICILNCLLKARDPVLGTYHQHLPQSMTGNRYRINTWNWVGLNWAELQSSC